MNIIRTGVCNEKLIAQFVLDVGLVNVYVKVLLRRKGAFKTHYLSACCPHSQLRSQGWTIGLVGKPFT